MNETVYRSLFAAYPDALLLVDKVGVIVMANPAAATLLGYTTDELRGLPVDTLVPDSIRPRHAAYRDAYARKPHARPMGSQMDLVAKRRDGSEVMVEIALSPLHDHGLPYTVAAIRGIGAYPRVKQALQRARYAEHVAQFGRTAVDTRDPRELLEQGPIVAAAALQVPTAAVYLAEADGPGFRLVAGTGLVGEAPGQRCTLPEELPRGYRDAGFVAALAVPIADRGRVAGMLVVRSRTEAPFGEDETRFLESLSTLLATSLQRAHSEEALQHAQRLESVGQLTGGIAHDFNNLLTVISGNLQVLEELPALAQDAFGAQLVAAASRATRRGAELTGKLLAFSRRQVLQPEPVDTGAMLLSLAGMLRRTLDPRIRIEVDAPPNTLRCLVDPGQLEAALLNIAINARDAMPDGGTLSFRAALLEAPAQQHGGLEPAPDGYVAISVADTGTGMPEAVRERAFEPFFTTKEAGRGTGLGLSTVYGFAKQSHGAVTLASTPGAGTTVTLLLPRALAAAADEPAADDAGQAVPEGLRVLMVEDDPEVRVVVQAFLAALRCEVTTCADAAQALAVLDTGQPCDLLLTDIALGPGLRGTDLAREALQRQPGLPVLLMSGYASGLLDAPVDWELLRKPYTRAELAHAIVRALGQTA